MPKVIKNPSDFKGPRGPLKNRCPRCQAPGHIQCRVCRVVSYCCFEHQEDHHPQHKLLCHRITKAFLNLKDEESQIRNAAPDHMTSANAFVTDVGHFFELIHTRNYMWARFALAWKYLAPVGTLASVGTAYKHMLEMLRLCRADNLGMRELMPAMMLRLDLDEKCYSFVKWWVTCDIDGTYDWTDMTLPYLNIYRSDILEDQEWLIDNFATTNHMVAILILKLKLLVDIRNLKVTRKVLHGRLPRKLWKHIELAVVRSPLSVRLQEVHPKHLLGVEATLIQHCCELGAYVNVVNSHFMPSLFNPDSALSKLPHEYMEGSWEETAFVMQVSYAAWWETEGVLELLNDARMCAVRMSADNLADLSKVELPTPGQDSKRTAGDLVLDLGVGLIWTYLKEAVDNASCLSPWSERPSERSTREARERLKAELMKKDELENKIREAEQQQKAEGVES